MARKKDRANKKPLCMVPGCKVPQWSCGQCKNHYNQSTRKGPDGKPLRPFQWFIDQGFALAPHSRSLLRRAVMEVDAMEAATKRKAAGI